MHLSWEKEVVQLFLKGVKGIVNSYASQYYCISYIKPTALSKLAIAIVNRNTQNVILIENIKVLLAWHECLQKNMYSV